MPLAAEIYYHEFLGGDEGRIPPVVLLHGAGGNHLYWPSEIRRLSGQRVYALDLPGHGRSTGRAQQSIAGHAQAVLAWMQAMLLHRAVFVGHSMGAAVALTLALEAPEQIIGLGLVGAGARLPVNSALLEGSTNVATFHNTVDAVTQWSFAPETSPALVELASRRLLETRPTVLHADFLACDAFDLSERVGEITQPTLVVCGAQDRMTPPRYSQFLAGAIPNARLELIPAAGHMVMLEKPQEVASALQRFINTLPFG